MYFQQSCALPTAPAREKIVMAVIIVVGDSDFQIRTSFSPSIGQDYGRFRERESRPN